MRAWHARLLALIAAATLLLPATSLAEVLYRCRMTGAIGPKCCCARDQAQAPSLDPCQPMVDRPECCEAQAQSMRAAPGSTSDGLRTVAPAALISTLDIAELALPQARSARFARRFARGPPSIGPPVYLENCSLLR